MDAKTMGKWGMALGPEVVEQIHRRIVAIAREHRVRLTHSELLVSSRVGFAPDSPLEESGFEPLVPLGTEMLIELARGISNATRMLAVGDIGPVPRLC
jgi:hypothetical protein